jgi:putative membrane protein
MPSELRLHPSSVVFGFLTQIKTLVVPGVLVLVGARSRGGDWEAWALLFVIPAAIAAAVRYISYRYRYDPHEMVVRHGLVFRKERHIPYARIQNIDAVQHVLHRLLNVVEVRVETGGGTTPEATMSVLPMDAYLEMRRRVFAGRESPAAAVPDGAGAVPAAPPMLALDTRELLLSGFIDNRGAVVIAAAMGLFWELGLFDRALRQAAGDDVSGRGMIRDLVRSAVSNAVVSVERLAIALLALAGLLLVVRLLSMVWAVIRLHGFALTLAGDDLRSQYGLLTRVAATIPLRRIQALTIRETPLHRLFGRVAVSADTAGGQAGGDARRERELLAPLLRRASLEAFVATVLDGVRLDQADWQPVAQRAVRREIKGWLVAVAAMQAAAVAVAGWSALIAAPVLAGWAVVGARRTIAHLGWALTGDALLFRRGWLWRRVTVVRLAKIQAVMLVESPFDRRTAMARLRVDTAGASELTRIDVPYLARDTAGRLHVSLARAAGETQFKW